MLVAQGDGAGALTAYRARAWEFGEKLAARDPANTAVATRPVGQPRADRRRAGGAGRRRRALTAYRASLGIREKLAARDPANAQAQADVAVSCAKLGLIDYGQNVDERRRYLLRGREILLNLKSTAKLLPNQDWIAWFDERLDELP